MNPTQPNHSGTDVILWHYTIPHSTGVMTLEQWRVFEGDDDDHGLDVKIMGIQDIFGHAPNEVVFCGQFESEIDTSDAGVGNMMPALAGAGGIDGFIGTCDYNLGNIGWFNAEGSVLGQNESVDALAFDTTSESVYAVGKFERTASATLLASGSLAMSGPTLTGLFTLQFQPDGTFIDASQADPNNTGVNEHTDVAIVDTSCITTGVMAVPSGFRIDFNNAVPTNTGNHEVFIARFDAGNNGFYKKGKNLATSYNLSLATLFPNPNKGEFTLKFEQKFSGKISLYNSLGQLLSEQFETGTQFPFVIHNPVQGIYFLRAEGMGEVLVFSVLIQ
jgi:hypothetical protein